MTNCSFEYINKSVRVSITLIYYLLLFQEDTKMNKKELVAAVAEKSGVSKKEAEAVINAFTDVVTEELVKGEKIQMVGFGTFAVSEKAAREGRNPKTGEKKMIAASKAPKFKAGKALKDAVNA